MKTLSKYMLLGVAGMGLWSCSSEEAVKELTGSGRTVQITVNVSREGDAATRTQMSDEGANLGCVWTEGDKLLVTDASGAKKGVLNLTEINAENPSMATFNGQLDDVTIVDGKSALNFMYLGTKWDATAAIAENKYVADYSQQDGSLKSLTDKDMLAKSETVTAFEDKDGKCRVYVESLNLKRQISFARFKLDQLPDGVTLGPGTSVTVSDINSTANLATTDLTPTYGAGSVTITPTEEGNEFYMVLLPTTDTPTIKFTVSANGYSYTATKAATAPIAAEKYYRHQNGSEFEGIAVTDWEKKELPIDYEDLGNWGIHELTEPQCTDNGLRVPTKDSSEVGWLYNQFSSIIQDCWFDPITFTKNGTVDGYLYSTYLSYPSYYQWGRWLGFPLEIGISPIFTTYYNGWTTTWKAQNRYDLTVNSYPVCLDPDANPQDSKFGYTMNNIQPVYSRIGTTKWASWDVQKSIYAASVWGMDETKSSYNRAYDYIVGGYNKDAVWEDRSGNPCPDGYRLPNKSELQSLVPSKVGFKKHAEIKESSSGRKYAMKWEVVNILIDENYVYNVGFIGTSEGITSNITNTNYIPAVKITSFPVQGDVSSISVDDKRFNEEGVSQLTIGAYGVLGPKGTINNFGRQAIIWGRESVKLTGSISGYAGAALKIMFENDQIKSFSVGTFERAQGANIIPVRDNKAKGSTIKPYWPYCMIGLE